MKRDKRTRYVTIPYQGTKPEWVSGVSTEELLAAHGTNVGALGGVAVSYSLEKIADELGDPRVLVVGYGEEAVRTIRACRDAGLDLGVVYTEDKAAETYVKLAPNTVCIGEAFSENLFRNSYAILTAARECDAQAVLFLEPTLASDEGFLGLAANRTLKVFKALDPAIPQAGWLICNAAKPIREESWRTCSHCGLLFDERGLALSHFMCPACGSYFRMSSSERVNDLLDAESFIEWERHIPQRDPLGFPGYLEKLDSIQADTGLTEAVRCGEGRIAGIRFALCIMDPTFLMGSMGSVVGEKITRTIERATEESLPLVICTASGGARMQEGILSLMQMAKVSAAIARHAEAGAVYISVLTDPTTGGVTASFAMQADVIIAEPSALIGFAGQRVIRDTIKRELPEGFQTAEFALEHGLIDAIVNRERLRGHLAHILAIHKASSPAGLFNGGEVVSYAIVNDSLEHGTYNSVMYGMFPQIRKVFLSASKKIKPSIAPTQRGQGRLFGSGKKRQESKQRLDMLLHGRLDAEEGLSLEASSLEAEVASARINRAWQSVQLARNTQRPTAKYYIDSFVDGFIELHGDRGFADDGAIICGIGWIGTRAVTVIAQEKGADLKERVARNFGCPQPEGYRKSLRIMRQAEKFGRPVVCLVDTQGAFCGMGAEERGQGNAIAENLLAMATLEVPIVSVLLGEGGSGGALALALADRVAMQEHAVYSVLSPEGFASILWKDPARAPEAAAVMKMSAEEAYQMGVVDAVLSEGDAAAHENPEVAAACVRGYLVKTLDELEEIPKQQLLAMRYERFRKF